MKITRKCVVCKKTKTRGAGKFTKVKNVVKHIPECMKFQLGNFKLDDYVCSRCTSTLKRLEE